MSVFFVKTNDMNPVVELVTVEGVKMNISNVYDRIEAVVDRELEKFDNTFFEVYDDELTSKGSIVIGNGALEDELQVLKTVKDTIGKIKCVEIVIDEMPSIPLGIYNYEFEINIRGVITPQPPIKVLNLTTEQFEELIDEEVFFIEYGTRLVKDEDTKVQYKTTEEVLEAINDLIGILNIKEAKEFVFKYGDRRNEAKDIYDELLLEKIEYSDEIVDKEIQIEEIRLEDYNDWGIKCGGLLIGYNIQY